MKLVKENEIKVLEAKNFDNYKDYIVIYDNHLYKYDGDYDEPETKDDDIHYITDGNDVYELLW